MNFIDVLISTVLGLIMFGIGSSISFNDIKDVFKDYKLFFTGLGLQMIFLPLFAFGIAYFSDLPPELKVGLFIVSICPGGATSNFIAYLVNANTALSIAMTCVNSVLILFSIPFLSNKVVTFFTGSHASVQLSFLDTFTQVFLIIIIPAALGILFNKYYGDLALKLKKPLKMINVFLLACVFAIKFFAGKDSGGTGISTSEIFKLLPFCLLLHIGSLLISYFFSKIVMKIKGLDATTIGIEVGLQNTTLALLVTGTILNNVEMSKPAMVFALFSFFTTLIFAYLTTSFDKNQNA